MAKIRQFTPAKQNKDKVTEFEQRIKNYRKNRIMKMLLLGVFVIVVIWASTYVLKNSSYSYYSEISSFPRISSGDSVCLNHNGNILTYSKDGINSTDTRGNVIWNETYQMHQPIVHVNEKYVAIGDYGGHVIFVMDTKGKVGEIDTNLPIRNLSISKTGVIAAVLEDNKVMKINLYDSKGKQLVESETHMSQNGYPVSIALSDTGEIMEVSYFYVDTGKVKSSVAFYNFSEVGQNNIDRLISGNEYADAIMPYIGFFGDGSSYAVGNGRVSFYSSGDKPVSVAEKLLTEEIQAIYKGENHIALVFVDTTGAGLYRIDLYDKKGNIIMSRNVNIQISDILIQKNDIIVYNDKECAMYSMTGREKYSGSFGKSVSLLIPTTKGNSFIMVTPVSVDVIELM